MIPAFQQRVREPMKIATKAWHSHLIELLHNRREVASAQCRVEPPSTASIFPADLVGMESSCEKFISRGSYKS